MFWRLSHTEPAIAANRNLVNFNKLILFPVTYDNNNDSILLVQQC